LKRLFRFATEGCHDLLSGEPKALEATALFRIRVTARVRHKDRNDKNSSGSKSEKTKIELHLSIDVDEVTVMDFTRIIGYH
jgi:hypothetical protein